MDTVIAHAPVVGVVALCVGIAFVLSAIVSFILSRRLKLFEPPASADV